MTRDVDANDAPYKVRGQNPLILAQGSVVNTQAGLDQLSVQASRQGRTIVATYTVSIRL